MPADGCLSLPSAVGLESTASFLANAFFSIPEILLLGITLVHLCGVTIPKHNGPQGVLDIWTHVPNVHLPGQQGSFSH